MSVIDYNGTGRWSVEAVQGRYEQYARTCGVKPLSDLTPCEHRAEGKHWIYPVMDRVIKGIERGDPACAEIGIEFIEESVSFPFGMSMKSKVARLLGRVELTDGQKWRIRRRVVVMLCTGCLPREFREYAKLARKIGLAPLIPQLEREADLSNPRVRRCFEYFKAES